MVFGAVWEQSKSTKLLNISIIKKGGVRLQTCGGGEEGGKWPLFNIISLPKGNLYSIDSRQCLFMCGNCLTLQMRCWFRSRHKSKHDITYPGRSSRGQRWEMISSDGSRFSWPFSTKSNNSDNWTERQCFSDTYHVEENFEAAFSYYHALSDVLTPQDPSLPLKSINVRRRGLVTDSYIRIK